jgi:hypothetical protein
VNDPPLATPVDLGTMPDNGTRIITEGQLLVGVTDIDGPAPAIIDLQLTAGGGSLVNNGDGTWTYSPVPGDDAVTFSYTASDGTDTASSTASLNVDPPAGTQFTLDLDDNNSNGGGFDYTSSFHMGGPAMSIADTDVSIVDTGSATVQSALLRMIGNGQVPPNDVLVAGTLPAGISASSYDPLTGTMTLTGVATLADYEAALQQIFFTTTDPFYNADRIISVTLNDGADISNTAQTFMHVVSVFAAFRSSDVIDLSVLLDARFEAPDLIEDHVRLVESGSDITLQIDVNGTDGGANWRDVAILTGYGTAGADAVTVFFENQNHTLTV